MAPKVAASDEKKKKMTLLQRKIRLSVSSFDLERYQKVLKCSLVAAQEDQRQPFKQKYSVRPEKKHKKKGAYPKVTLRKSLTPGTIVILVAGKQVHRGRRLVFVKMLDSGHLLLAGPKGLNRMPLMPVLQNFVIATSTSIPLTDAVKTQADKIDFSMFKKLQEKKSKESGIFTDSAAKASTEPRIDPEVEKALDDALMASVENFSKDPLEKEIFTAYMRQKFTLKNGLMPHNMKF